MKRNESLLIATIVLYLLLFINIITLWLQYVSLDLYNYLTITPLIILIIYYGVLRKYSLVFSIKKIVVFTTLYLLGGFLVFYSILFEALGDQIIILGMLLLIQSIISLYVSNKDIYKVLLLTFSLLILIPLPQNIVYELSAVLTRIVLSFSIPLTEFLGVDLKVNEESGYIIVNVLHGNEYVRFEIAPICSGVIGLLSVVAVAPIIIYVSINGVKELFWKVLGGIIGVLILSVLMIIVNTIRLTMMFYFTSLYGFEIGYNIFHYTPEILLVIPTVFLVVKIVDKIAGNASLFPSKIKSRNNDEKYENISEKKYLALLPIILILPIAFPIINTSFQTPKLIFINVETGPIMLFNITSGVKELFVPRVFRNVYIEYIGRQYDIEKGLYPTHRIHVYRALYDSNKILDIYIEFSSKPSIHIWELCLWWQNITVLNESEFLVFDPSGEIIFAVKELSYSGKFLKGYLVSWRNKYYTERGIEYTRFTIMLNIIREQSITDKDKEFVKDLARNLVIKGIDASYVKYSKIAGFKPVYFLNIILPFTIIVMTLLVFIEALINKRNLQLRYLLNRILIYVRKRLTVKR